MAILVSIFRKAVAASVIQMRLGEPLQMDTDKIVPN
jgi:hypothetical protein